MSPRVKLYLKRAGLAVLALAALDVIAATATLALGVELLRR